MRPRKAVLLCCSDEFESARLKLIMELRLHIKVTVAYGLGIVLAAQDNEFHCAILINQDVETIDFLRARDMPTLELGNGPSYADRCVSGPMMDVLEAIRLMCTRKRGPRKQAA